MKKKYVALSLILSLITAISSGCGFTSDVKVNANGTAKVSMTTYFNQEEVDEFGDSAADLKPEIIDGKKFYKDTTTTDTISWSDLRTSNIALVTKDYIAVPSKSEEDTDFMHVIVSVPFKIAKTNCKKVNSKTVKFDAKYLNDDTDTYHTMYVTKDASLAKGKHIAFAGAENKCWYNHRKRLWVASSNGIIDTIIEEHDGNVISHPVTETSFLADGGWYKFKVTTVGAGKKTISFGIDRWKPGCNVKKGKQVALNKKLVFYDNGGSGVKSALLNQVNILKKSKYDKVSNQYSFSAHLRRGKSVLKLKDKAGNEKTIVFYAK